MKNLIDKLRADKTLSKNELEELIAGHTEKDSKYLFKLSDRIRREIYEDKVYIRGLIEISNYCRNDCYYCGIRRSNSCADRYRLSKETILGCCKRGYALGFRTFVLQGGEDAYFTDDVVCSIVSEIKSLYQDCAVTLSIGEKSRESYKRYFDCGADRYLLRHETACDEHYRMLHPKELSPENRKRCLYDLKDIGYQVGSGFMVGSPYQTAAHLAEDMKFLEKLKPDMIGIGPFVPHKDTPFKDKNGGTVELTLFMIGLLRLMFPCALLPATTALGTIHPEGRQLGLKAGANVVMPNLSPKDAGDKYTLYNNKLHTGAESADKVNELRDIIASAGYRIVVDRGDRAEIK